MIMTPGSKSRAGGIVLNGTLNKNPYCLVSRNDRPIKKTPQNPNNNKKTNLSYTVVSSICEASLGSFSKDFAM